MRLFFSFLAVASCVVLSFIVTADLSRNASEERVAQHGQDILRLYVANLEGHLAKYASFPRILSVDPRVKEALEAPSTAKNAALNDFLLRFTELSGAREAYLMDRQGLTVAASNWQRADSFLGKNFAFRPYFQSAIAGETGRYFALGTTSGQRGFYFSEPIFDKKGDILGVIVIKSDLEAIEQGWNDQSDRIVVTDPDGVVFISSVREWLFRSIRPLSSEDLGRINESLRYPGHSILPIRVLSTETSSLGHVVFTLPLREGPVGDELSLRDSEDFLQLSQSMSLAGWTVHIFTDARQIKQQVGQNILLLMLGGGLLGMALFTLRLRLDHYRQRLEMEQTLATSLRQARDALEGRVKERTADLQTANDRLRTEMGEREAVQIKLRVAQDNLVQAGKLAAIGQLAAEITHEINQPLAALRAYAENGSVLLARQRYDDTDNNLKQIIAMSERIGTLSRQLKGFARRTRAEIGPVNLSAALALSLELVAASGRLKEVVVSKRVMVDEPIVLAESARLEQVFVNLLNNALDAMKNTHDKKISIICHLSGESYIISFVDNGTGLSPEIAENLFTPFYTTKSDCGGLGLGLSISHGIIEEFGGTVSATAALEGGTVFTLTLPKAPSPPESWDGEAIGG